MLLFYNCSIPTLAFYNYPTTVLQLPTSHNMVVIELLLPTPHNMVVIELSNPLICPC